MDMVMTSDHEGRCTILAGPEPKAVNMRLVLS